jgi:hypothetical protein
MCRASGFHPMVRVVPFCLLLQTMAAKNTRGQVFKIKNSGGRSAHLRGRSIRQSQTGLEIPGQSATL